MLFNKVGSLLYFCKDFELKNKKSSIKYFTVKMAEILLPYFLRCKSQSLFKKTFRERTYFRRNKAFLTKSMQKLTIEVHTLFFIRKFPFNKLHFGLILTT